MNAFFPCTADESFSLHLQKNIHSHIPVTRDNNGHFYAVVVSFNNLNQKTHQSLGEEACVKGFKSFLLKATVPPAEHFSYQMEGLTKWDLGSGRTYYSVESSEKFQEDEYLDGSVVLRLETELWKAQSRIKELEAEKFESKGDIRCFNRDQRNSWEVNPDPLDYLKKKLSKEREERKRANAENAMLKKKVWDMESSANRLRRERDTLEKVCEELVTRIEELKAETRRKWDETEKERQMLEMAEMWREESVRVKLMDAKISLEEKYAEMNWVVDELEKCLVKARKAGPEEMQLKRVEGLIKTARSLEDAANNIDLERI